MYKLFDYFQIVCTFAMNTINKQTYKKMETIQETKKPITAILKKMNVGDREQWPRQRARTLRVTIGNLQLETNLKFRTYRDGDFIVVTRIL